jgi:PAT family acetyl-CoA transporter-like MFS transporter 1
MREQKLLWAPIVDSYYSRAFGRRRSWLVPVQLLCSFIMILSPSAVNRMLDDVDVLGLTACFFFLYLLMATQDIAVDGWALTMLSRRNVG